jgi:hypothetical protein
VLLGLHAVLRTRSVPRCHLPSVNDAVLDGPARAYTLRKGDVLSADLAVSYETY